MATAVDSVRSIHNNHGSVRTTEVLELQLCPLGEGITNFTVPLSPAFVQRTWSTSAYQLTSGHSVVVMDPEKKTVYKNPLHGRAKERGG